jgi:hypothetical protein
MSDPDSRPPPESDRLQDILRQLQSINSLPPSEQRPQLERLIACLQDTPPNEDLQPLLTAIDSSLSEFVGDPRRFVSCISTLLSAYDRNPDRAQRAVQQFVQERTFGEASLPSPFDWTMVDILLSQLSRLSGETAPFTREMCDSVVFTLFRPAAEAHFLQGLVSQFLALSVGEHISVVKSRMRMLSHAPLSKVTHLSNVLLEIHEKYERELEKLEN